ncbi:MAG TPA: helix-turn-helix transcriptional regulator [Steroidobacteraceae bacterium]|nr:helix-turn-helix transcriptional regulator [Steroidobacteraceae bacterium]
MLAPVKPSHERLLTQLAEFARGNPLSSCVRVQAKEAYMLHALNIDTALFAIPLEGCKRFRRDSEWLCVTRGDVFLVPAPQALDVENVPDERAGRYLAIGIPLHANILEAARQLIPNPIGPGASDAASISLEPYVDDLSAWLSALVRKDALRVYHAMVGLVLRLYENGFQGLLQPRAPTLSAQIRAKIAVDPAKDWSSEELEHALSMSGATLRRRLAAEGTSLRDVIAEARLSQAFALLSTTDLPVKTVAVRVGYNSASTFARRFSERYGVEPSRLSNA